MSYTPLESSMVDHLDEYQDFYKDDYVTLSVRGDVWQVVTIASYQGYTNDHMLTLRWVTGETDPGRLVKFGSSTARKLTAMEVIAISSKHR